MPGGAVDTTKPPTVATQTVAPADVTIAPKISDKITAGAAYLTGTGIVGGAPLLNNIDPSLNPHHVGGIEVAIIGDGILVFVHAFQGHRWYDRNKWGIWTIIALAVAFCMVLYWWEDPVKGVLNALAAMTKAFQAFGPLSKLGVLAGQTERATEGVAAGVEETLNEAI